MLVLSGSALVTEGAHLFYLFLVSFYLYGSSAGRGYDGTYAGRIRTRLPSMKVTQVDSTE